MSTIIFTADDYGCHTDIDNGIIMAVESGWINSVAMFGNGPDLANSATRIKQYQDKGKIEIGCHLTITSGSPVSEQMKKCLVFVKDGHFRNYMFLKRDGTSDADQRDEIKQILKAELVAQIKSLTDNGIVVRHLSHHHNALCSFPEYMEALFEVATEMNASKETQEHVRVRSANLLPKVKNLLLPVVLSIPSNFSMDTIDRKTRTVLAWTINHWVDFYNEKHSDAPRTPKCLDAFHYGPLGIRSPGESTSKRLAKKKSKEISNRVKEYIDDDISVEIVFHLIELPPGLDWEANEDSYTAKYSGVATNYFDSRQIEFESLKLTFGKNKEERKFELEMGAWKNI